MSSPRKPWIGIFIFAVLLGVLVFGVVYVVNFEVLSAGQPSGLPAGVKGVSTFSPSDAWRLAVPAGIGAFLFAFLLGAMFTSRK